MPALDEARVKDWRYAAEQQPLQMTDIALRRAVHIRSVSIVSGDDGIGLRCRAHGGALAELILNPVVAQQIMLSILKGGNQQGWLDDELKLVIEQIQRS